MAGNHQNTYKTWNHQITCHLDGDPQLTSGQQGIREETETTLVLKSTSGLLGEAIPSFLITGMHVETRFVRAGEKKKSH